MNTEIETKNPYIVGIEIDGQDGGTGFFIREDLILTALHVLQNKEEKINYNEVQYYFKGEKETLYKAHLHAYDKIDSLKDWAILKAEIPLESFSNEIMSIDYKTEVKEEDNIYSFGYPQGGNSREDGVKVEGTLTHSVKNRKYNWYLVVDPRYNRIDYSCFSGSPCFYENSIIGILIFQYEDFSNIGIRTIKSFYEDIKEYLFSSDAGLGNEYESNIDLDVNPVSQINEIHPESNDFETFDQKFLDDYWQILLSLHHLLPTNYLISLCNYLINFITKGAYSFSDYFILDQRSADNINKFLVLPSERFFELPHIEILDILLSLIEGNDNIFLSYEKNDLYKRIKFSIELGQSDFGVIALLEKDFPLNLNDFFSIFGRLLYECSKSNSKQIFDTVQRNLTEFDSTMKLVILKHISDLFVDKDEWELAKHGYELFQEEFAKISNKDQEILLILNQFVESSLGTCIIVIEGRNEAFNYYKKKYENANINKNRYFYLNSAYDAMNSEKDIFPKEFRKLYYVRKINSITSGYNSHLSRRINSWLNNDYYSSFRLFWADLRRGIAIGDYSNFLSTKFSYANCLLDSIIEQKNSMNSLDMAMSLIIESTKANEIEKINWIKYGEVVNEFLTEEYFDKLILKSEKYSGVKEERINSILVLFKSLIPIINENKLILKIWQKSILLLQAYDFSDSKTSYLAEIIYKLLEKLVREKWEIFSFELKNNLTDTFFAKLQGQQSNWIYEYQLFGLMNEYISFIDLEEDKISNIIKLILEKPDRKNIHTLRELFILLSNDNLKDFYQRNPIMKEKVIDYIVGFIPKLTELNSYYALFIYCIDESFLIRMKDDSIYNNLFEDLFNINLNSDIEYNKLVTLSLILDSLTSEESNKYFSILFSLFEEKNDHFFLFRANDSLLNTLHFYKTKQKNFESNILELFRKMQKLWINIKDYKRIFSGYNGIFNPNSRADKYIAFNFSVIFIRYAVALNKLDTINVVLENLEGDLSEIFTNALVREYIFDKKIKESSYIDKLCQVIRKEDIRNLNTAISSIVSNLQNFNKKNRLKLLEELKEKVFQNNPIIEHLPILAALTIYKYRVRNDSIENYKQKLSHSQKINSSLSPYIDNLQKFDI